MDRMRIVPVLALALLVACGGGEEAGSGGQQQQQEPSTDANCFEEGTTTSSGLEISDIECGDGAEATAGSTVEVHYVGTLENGEKFDSSRDRDAPFQFSLGAGQVIAGWDEGIEGMKVGGIRELTIPPELGYGEMGSPPVIPPNSTLIFEVELLRVL